MFTTVIIRHMTSISIITSDIKQAFLQIELDVMHRDFTRFLWFGNFYSGNRDNVIYRFTRILFGLTTCSPFILTGTLKHHFKKSLQEKIYPKVFIEKLLKDLYVNDLLSSFNDANIAYEFYQAANEILQSGGFHLCKWASNCKELQDKIITDSNVTPNTTSNIRIVLGIEWDTLCDEFIFDFEKIINTTNSLDCTKRNVLKITAVFYDPNGLLCPIALQLKLLFTKIFSKKSDWHSLLHVDIQLIWS